MSLSVEWLAAIGLIIILSELALGLFVPIWYGIGFLILALAQLVTGETWSLGAQLAIAFSSGTVLMLLLRKKFFKSRKQDQPIIEQSTFKAGGQGVLIKNVANGSYQVKANGTYWRIANVSSLNARVLEAMENKEVEIESFVNNEVMIKLPE